MSSSDVIKSSSDVTISSSDVIMSSSDVIISSSDVIKSSSDVIKSNSDARAYPFIMAMTFLLYSHCYEVITTVLCPLYRRH